MSGDSDSTRRRRQRNAERFDLWRDFEEGGRVTVQRANGGQLRTVTISEPWLTDEGGAYVRVKGIPGNTALRRVVKGWLP